MQRFWIGLTVWLALAAPGLAQTTPAGPVSPLKPVITSYPNSPFSVSGGVATLTLGSSANELRLPNGTNLEYGGCAWISNVFTCTVQQNSGTARNMTIGPIAGASLNFQTSGNAYFSLNSSGHLITANSQPASITAPTDSTVVIAGELTRFVSSSTITPATAGVGNCGAAFQAAALTADCTIGTLPAGMKLTAVYADVTVGFACSGTCSGTKVFQCGTAVNGTQVFAANLNVAVTGTFGLADADLGSGMTRAAAIQGGLIGSWSATTPISCRFTSGTGNWGSGAATFVNAGSIKFILVTEQIK